MAYPFDVEKANDLERLLELAVKRGDKQMAIKIDREMQAMENEARSYQTLSARQNPNEYSHPLAKEIAAGDGFFGDFGSGFKRGFTTLSGGALQRMLEFGIPRQEQRLKEFADKMNSGEIPTTDANLEKFDEMSILLDRARQKLEGGIATEKEVRSAYDEAQDRSPMATTAGNIAGQVSMAASIAPQTIVAAPKSMMGKMAVGATEGAAIGALQPTLEGESVKQNAAIGAVIGGAAPPVIEKAIIPIASKAASIPANLIRRFKANKNLIDEATGLPSPAFEKALKDKGMDFGAIVNDVDSLPVIRGDKPVEDIVDDIIASQLRSGRSSDALYKYRLAGGRVVDDPIGEEALKQGYLKGDIAAAKTADKSTRKEMEKMLRMKRQIHADSSKSLEFRPSDVVGENVMKRFKYVRDEANTLRSQLDEIANKRLKGMNINSGKVADDFFDGLDKLKIAYDNSLPPKLDFKNSLISEDKTSQRVINSVTRLLSKDGPIDAHAAHLLKRQLDTMLDFNKKSAAGLTDAGEKFAKGIRASLNDSIRDVSKPYATVNDQLSEALGVMQEFDSALGRVDVFGEGAEQAVGQTLRRLLSNVQSRTELDNALMNLDEFAVRMGGTFDANIKKLVQFNKTLDDRFGATARGSFQGEIESAIRSGPKQAVKDFAVKKAAEKVEEFRGINDSNAFNVMQRILSR